MQAGVFAIAKHPQAWLQESCARYAKQIVLPWKVEYQWLPLSRLHGKDDSRAMQEDCQRLLKVSDNRYRIALDSRGKNFTSEGFSEWLEALPTDPKPCFLIGGPLGFDRAMRAQCDAAISLSALTFPHGIAMLLLMEQLYRANCITRNHSYHK